MPFERLKSQLQREAEAQQVIKDQRKRDHNAELNNRRVERKAELKQEKKLTSCFVDSGIDGLINQLIKIDPSLRKNTFWPEETIEIHHHHLFRTDTISSIEIYNVIKLDHTTGSITVGFTREGTLIVKGRDVEQIPQQIWRSNPAKIESALENAYLKPEPNYGAGPPRIDGY